MSRVALAAKAVLRCKCGAVGIVIKEEVGNGCISCPGCDARYCVDCTVDLGLILFFGRFLPHFSVTCRPTHADVRVFLALVCVAC